MTDKQIIIDGVDVGGCDFLAKEDDYCSYSGITYAYKGQCGCSDEEMCKDHPNCFYKKALRQLKRKEQECETLASQLDFEVQKKECLEQECENLKVCLFQVQNASISLTKQLDQLKASNASFNDIVLRLSRHSEELKEQLEAYKMEAEEGKEINAELKAENEELKKKVESYVCSTNCYKYKEADQLKAENKHLNDLLNQALKELEQSRESLTKI